jgi:hypothetical protein
MGARHKVALRSLALTLAMIRSAESEEIVRL